MTIIIAGERSGVGKTTVTLAILAYLTQISSSVQSFKVGPDFIDPMFHKAITKRPCRNLDPVLTSETYVNSCFARHCQTVDYALIEGVMGLFDGISFREAKDYASTAHIARLLNIPVLLVLDCSRLSGSVAAIAHGYRSLDPRIKLAGLVLNRVASDRHLELLQDALKPLDLPILGVLRRQNNITIPDRHLGLVPSEEITELNAIFARLAALAQTSFDWKRLFPLLKADSFSPVCTEPQKSPQFLSLRIAIACDRAFNFYYQDNLDFISQLGAELVFWSPLQDRSLPDNIHGLYFGGGFPEVFADELAANQPILSQVKKVILAGIPTYAECGGLMYLGEKIIDFSDRSWQMARLLPTIAQMSQRLHLGYRQARVVDNSFLLQKGEILRGHEFHRSSLTVSSQQPLWSLTSYQASSQPVKEGWKLPYLHASYLHLHWGIYSFLPTRWLKCCQQQKYSLEYKLREKKPSRDYRR